jgi:hypothetical protein
LKRYCECFHGGVFCSTRCRCSNCQNYDGCEELHRLRMYEAISTVKKPVPASSSTSARGRPPKAPTRRLRRDSVASSGTSDPVAEAHRAGDAYQKGSSPSLSAQSSVSEGSRREKRRRSNGGPPSPKRRNDPASSLMNPRIMTHVSEELGALRPSWSEPPMPSRQFLSLPLPSAFPAGPQRVVEHPPLPIPKPVVEEFKRAPVVSIESTSQLLSGAVVGGTNLSFMLHHPSTGSFQVPSIVPSGTLPPPPTLESRWRPPREADALSAIHSALIASSEESSHSSRDAPTATSLRTIAVATHEKEDVGLAHVIETLLSSLSSHLRGITGGRAGLGSDLLLSTSRMGVSHQHEEAEAALRAASQRLVKAVVKDQALADAEAVTAVADQAVAAPDNDELLQTLATVLVAVGASRTLSREPAGVSADVRQSILTRHLCPPDSLHVDLGSGTPPPTDPSLVDLHRSATAVEGVARGSAQLAAFLDGLKPRSGSSAPGHLRQATTALLDACKTLVELRPPSPPAEAGLHPASSSDSLRDAQSPMAGLLLLSRLVGSRSSD